MAEEAVAGGGEPEAAVASRTQTGDIPRFRKSRDDVGVSKCRRTADSGRLGAETKGSAREMGRRWCRLGRAALDESRMGSRPRGRCRGKRAFRADVVRIANSVKKPSSHLNPGGISPSSSDSSFRLAEVSGIATLFAATQLPYRKCVQTVSSTARSRPSRKLSTFSNTSSLSCRSMLRCSLSSRFFASECWRRVRGPRVIAAVSFATEGILDEPFDSVDRGVPFTRAMSGRAGGRGSAPPLPRKGKKKDGKFYHSRSEIRTRGDLTVREPRKRFPGKISGDQYPGGTGGRRS